MSIEKKRDTVNEEKKLERLIFAEYLIELNEELKKEEIFQGSIDELLDFIYSAKLHSIGESKTNKYFTTAEAFNFVINSLNSSDAILGGFDNSINELIATINRLKEKNVTEIEKLKIIDFINNLKENISSENINMDERNYFDW